MMRLCQARGKPRVPGGPEKGQPALQTAEYQQRRGQRLTMDDGQKLGEPGREVPGTALD